MSISIVIPAYNESKIIKSTLLKIYSFFNKKVENFEVIVVDDYSIDNTKTIIKKLNLKNCRIISNSVNRGKGYSVEKGILNAKYDYILFTDADLATPLEEFNRFKDKLDRYDIIIASRNMKGSNIQVHQPFYRQILGKLFPFFVSLLVVRGFKDTQCGFKLMKRKPAVEIAKRMMINRFAFDVEMLYIAKKHGYKILEMPVVWIDKADSKVSPIKDSIKMLYDLLRIRYNIFIRKY